MLREFEVIVDRLYSENEAKAWREPDAERPSGRAYGIQLERVVDEYGQRQPVQVGDRLRVTVDAEGDAVVSARLMSPR